MINLRNFGIKEEKNRKYENIAYTMALIYNICKNKIENMLYSHGISLAQFNILMALIAQNEKDGLSQVEIGNHLIVSSASITRLVEKLKNEDLITIIQNSQNRRQNIVKITDKGSEFVAKVWPEYDNLVGGLVNHVSQDKQSELADILSEWFVNLQK